MESEKVKEIKELLRCMNGEKACTNCYINEIAEEQETCCINVVADMTLELINELENENEKWQRKAVKYYQMAKSYGIDCIVDNEIDETLKEFNYE